MKSKLAIVDARCSQEIFDNLSNYAEQVFPFKSHDVTYESISCHPDIFIYQEREQLIIAPNSPQELIKTLDNVGIKYQFGASPVGETLHNSCYYNCLATESHFFHRKGFTDDSILRANLSKTFVALPQSYTRCSMLALNNQAFITSDAGIEKVLRQNGFEVSLFPPDEIKIAVHRHGFLGGTCGKYNDTILFLGNPTLHPYGSQLCQFIEKYGLKTVFLSNSMLYDGGGVIMVE